MSRPPSMQSSSQNGSNLSSSKVNAGAPSSGLGNSSSRTTSGLSASSHLPGHLSPYRDSASRLSNTIGASTNLAVGSPRSSALARDAASSLQYPTSASRPTSPSPEQEQKLQNIEQGEQIDPSMSESKMDDLGKTDDNGGVATRTRRKAKQELQQEDADMKFGIDIDSEDAMNAVKGGE